MENEKNMKNTYFVLRAGSNDLKQIDYHTYNRIKQSEFCYNTNRDFKNKQWFVFVDCSEVYLNILIGQ